MKKPTIAAALWCCARDSHHNHRLQSDPHDTHVSTRGAAVSPTERLRVASA